jgi:predicted phosphodiesterase
MRVAVLSDIHGNIHGLEAVLQALGDEAVDELWCLGDVVGYGARPNACCAAIAARATICLVGNHDLLALGRDAFEAEFNPEAAEAGRWTRNALEDPSRAFLAGLPSQAEVPDAQLFHGSPRDPVWEYVLSTLQADACMDAMEARVGAIGHSHVALFFNRAADGPVRGAQAPAGTEVDLSEGHWLINPGGVGQPRDGDPRAAWLLLDLESWVAEWRRVEYPIAEAAQAIERAGLPQALANRLYRGE